MQKALLTVFILSCILTHSLAQTYQPKIEPCPCLIKVDSSLISQCGYLVVPENRQRPAARTIKIPFIYVRKSAADTTTILYTTGGPGYSTVANYDSIGANSELLKFGGFIAFDQRGSKRSQPCLDCPEANTALQHGYRRNLNKDSLTGIALTQCRKRFTAQGIDLSAYNTIESAEDINDLRRALHLKKLVLFGLSYSGGLMLTVARNHPEGVQALLLMSPLPGFVNYEEHGLVNMNEALNRVFDNCETDSTDKALYGNLRQQFHRYFAGITGKRFTIEYVEKGKTDTLHIQYTKNELLDAIMNRMNRWQLQTVPFVMHDIINEHHEPYVKEILNGVFSGNSGLSHGMRYSIYCSEQIAYADEALIKKQHTIFPWFAQYAFNDANHALCHCWKVRPEPPIAKTPVYSTIPALIATGDADPWCPHFYSKLIKRTMPNSQLLLMHNEGHGPRLYVDGVDFFKLFMEDPYKKIAPTKNVIVE